MEEMSAGQGAIVVKLGQSIFSVFSNRYFQPPAVLGAVHQGTGGEAGFQRNIHPFYYTGIIAFTENKWKLPGTDIPVSG
jgi:hypothetical protein